MGWWLAQKVWSGSLIATPGLEARCGIIIRKFALPTWYSSLIWKRSIAYDSVSSHILTSCAWKACLGVFSGPRGKACSRGALNARWYACFGLGVRFWLGSLAFLTLRPAKPALSHIGDEAFPQKAAYFHACCAGSPPEPLVDLWRCGCCMQRMHRLLVVTSLQAHIPQQ